MLQVMHCVVLVTFVREKKRKRTTVQADSQGHKSHYHELMSRVWPVKAYFLLLQRYFLYPRNFFLSNTDSDLNKN